MAIYQTSGCLVMQSVTTNSSSTQKFFVEFDGIEEPALDKANTASDRKRRFLRLSWLWQQQQQLQQLQQHQQQQQQYRCWCRQDAVSDRFVSSVTMRLFVRLSLRPDDVVLITLLAQTGHDRSLPDLWALPFLESLYNMHGFIDQ